MQFKILIRLFVPEIEEEFEVYIPVNKTVHEITKDFKKIINIKSRDIAKEKEIQLFDRYTGNTYDYDRYIRETDIRNGSEIIAILQEVNAY